MISARLVAVTRPVDGLQIGNTPEAFVAYAARVSNPGNQMNDATASRLLRYLIRHQHWSPFEMAHAVVEIECPRDIGRQILRHRSFAFQEFCVAEGAMITLELPGAHAHGRRSAYKRPIEHLWKLQQRGAKLPSAVRVFDEETRTFVTAPIKEVFQTGVKPVFRLALENGRTIEATKEHKFLTAQGFKTMEDALGLSVAGGVALWSNTDVEFACNGVPEYQSRDWLSHAKAEAIAAGTGLQGIADAAGVTVHTIRKWLKVNSLQFTKKEVASYTAIWNKGRKWSRARHSAETIEKMRKAARRGPMSNLWRGGVQRAWRQEIADWCAANRSEFLISANYACRRCGGSDRLELHHKITVAERPDLGMDKGNIEVLCRECHRSHHGIAGDFKTWREKSRGNTLAVHWSRVKSVEFVGEKMTYDMEVGHVSHNYVANGIVTHNSQRYAAALDYCTREARRQDNTNRQNSTDDLPGWKRFLWRMGSGASLRLAAFVYANALRLDVAKECARVVLPEGQTMSRMYMAGSARSWVHYCQVRGGNGTQAEHMAVARACREALAPEFPALFGGPHDTDG